MTIFLSALLLGLVFNAAPGPVFADHWELVSFLYPTKRFAHSQQDAVIEQLP